MGSSLLTDPGAAHGVGVFVRRKRDLVLRVGATYGGGLHGQRARGVRRERRQKPDEGLRREVVAEISNRQLHGGRDLLAGGR